MKKNEGFLYYFHIFIFIIHILLLLISPILMVIIGLIKDDLFMTHIIYSYGMYLFYTMVLAIVFLPKKSKTNKGNLVSLFVYLFLMFMIFFFIFTKSLLFGLLSDTFNYYDDNYEYKTGIITDVKYQSNKHGDRTIKSIYIDGEKYKTSLITLYKKEFESVYDVNGSSISIEYLPNSKQILVVNNYVEELNRYK